MDLIPLDFPVTPRQLAEKIKIVADVQTGVVPQDVAEFAKQHEEELQDMSALLNIAQQTCDEWNKNERIKTPPAPPIVGKA